MKLRREEEVFTPVTITLESQEELDLMSDILCIFVENAHSTEHRDLVSKFRIISDTLSDFSSDEYNLVYIDDCDVNFTMN